MAFQKPLVYLVKTETFWPTVFPSIDFSPKPIGGHPYNLSINKRM